MQEHYIAPQNQLLSLSTNLKNASGDKNKRGVAQYMPSFDLTTLNGSNGFMVEGLALTIDDWRGRSVNTAGDLNGDGKADLVIGAYNASPDGRNYAGTVYVIFGQSNFPSAFNLTTLNGTNGFVVNGLANGDYLGFSVSTAGDINDDGKSDLVLGAWGACAAYVIFGQSNFPSPFNLTTLNGTNGFVVYGKSSSYQLGWSVSAAGDVNGDSKSDLVLGDDYASAGIGAVFVIFGQSNFPSIFDLTTLNGNNGFAVPGIWGGSAFGWSVSTAGDVNGDGKADIVLATNGGGPNNVGVACIIFGQSSFPASFDLTTLNGNNGFVVNGISNGDHLGNSVNTAGDINGDGKADILLGAPLVSNQAGAVYVIFGQNSFAPFFDLTTLNGTNGFVVNGIATIGMLGNSVSAAGDINKDGKTDFLLGANKAYSTQGAVYVVFGQSSFTSPFSLTSLNGANGFVVGGISAGDYLGEAVSTAGDMNGDGKSDIVLGTRWASNGAGVAYVIFGQNTTATPILSPISTPTPMVTPLPVSTPLTPVSMPATTPVLFNRPPEVIYPVMEQMAELDQPFNFQMASDTFNDPDGDPLTYTAAQSGSSALPNWLQFNTVTRFFSGIPNQTGITSINVTVSDPGGLKASNLFNIDVQNTLPVSSNDNASQINGGLIGGVIGGLAAVSGLAGAAYLAYKKGFFASSQNRNVSNNNNSVDTDIELKKKTIISAVG